MEETTITADNLGKTKGKTKVNPHRSLSFYDYHPQYFGEPKAKLELGFKDPKLLGYKEVRNVSPFIQRFYNRGLPSNIPGIPVSDRIFRGDGRRVDSMFQDLGAIYGELNSYVEQKDPLLYKSAVFSLKEIKSMIYLPGSSASYHHGMLAPVTDGGFTTVREPKLIKFMQDHITKAKTILVNKGKKVSVSIKRHTNTGGLLPSSGSNLHMNSLCLAVQSNIGLDADVSRLLEYEDRLKIIQRKEGFADTGFLRFFGYRFQNSASAMPVTELTNNGYHVTSNSFGKMKARVINFGGKETEISAKSWVNPQLHALKETPFVSTDPENTRIEQAKVLAHNGKSRVVSLDFVAFDSTIGKSTFEIVKEIHGPWLSKKMTDLWDFEASITSLSAPLHKGRHSVYVDDHPMSKLESGRWDTSVTGITVGCYLGLLAVLVIQYKNDFSAFEKGLNSDWHIADYGDDLQITTEATIDEIDGYLGKMGFNVEAEPTTSHLKVIIDHDRGVTHNSFFSMFKNLICPERPKTDKMTFALGIQARLESAQRDPLMALPSVKALMQKVLDYQGDFKDPDQIQHYLQSLEFEEDMQTYIKSSITRSYEMTEILAAATRGSFAYDDLPQAMTSVLGLTDFDLLLKNQDVSKIETLSKSKLDDIFDKLVKAIYFERKEYQVDALALLKQHFNYNVEEFSFG